MSDGRKSSMIQTLSSGVSKSSSDDRKKAAHELFLRKCAADPDYKKNHAFVRGRIIKIKRRQCAFRGDSGVRCTSAATRKCMYCSAPLCVPCARDTCVHLGGSETDKDFPIVCDKEGCQSEAAYYGVFEEEEKEEEDEEEDEEDE